MRAAPFHEDGLLPEGGLRVVLGSGHRPMTLTRSALGALQEALASWEERRDLRWIAFTSAGGGTFLAGADFSELAALGPEQAHAFSLAGQAFMARLRQSRLWLVACIHGACMGGGLDFALSCDYRIAAPGSRLAHPGPRLGLLTGWGGTWALPRRGGAGVPSLLAGRALGAREALRAGWIEEVAPDPLKRAAARARSSARLDLALVKRLWHAEGLPLSVALPYARLLAVEPAADEC